MQSIATNKFVICFDRTKTREEQTPGQERRRGGRFEIDDRERPEGGVSVDDEVN